jgi:hypothetical protein
MLRVCGMRLAMKSKSNEAQQGSPPSHRAFGTSGTSAAGQPLVFSARRKWW